ncbi:protein 1 (negative cofactor 2 alpha) [Nesidiocoris tenuis]|uniref:Protein 1 (Negative cofactor 2 alpha) n=1 Tax=Nesidiocoris tenuis TaxID=355587 RepID=A0ABN7ACY1_9HEMI|nr:protein 1 (negative cofactor 2 alpha) [Nesidiocoris tenuis]
MPSKKKKYNARFPAGRIKKIMQTDDEVGKVAQAVPVIISRTLEMFVKSLITKTMAITTMKNARTLSPHHMKQCILSEKRFDFLKDLVSSVPEAGTSDTDDADAPSSSQSRRRESQDSAQAADDELDVADAAQSGPSQSAHSVESDNSESESDEDDPPPPPKRLKNGEGSAAKKEFKFYTRCDSDEDYDA